MDELRVACIGAGYFSQFHYDSWRRIKGVRPIASVDDDVEKAEATGLPAYTTPEAMYANHSPDIVDIVTPPATHAALIRQAVDQGANAVICQKPFCTSLKEAEEIAEMSAARSVPVIVHENFRFQPWYREIAKQIHQGAIGNVLQATFRLRPGDGQGANAYLDRQPYFQTMPRFLVHETAVHWIDTFRFLLGPPKSIFADLRRLNPKIKGEDAGHILFDFGDGVRAMFDGNRHLDHRAENTRCTMGEALVEGTQGVLDLRGDGSVRYRKFGELEAETVFAAQAWKGFGGDCVFNLNQHVVDALRGAGEFENLAQDYLDVIRIEEAIYKSSERRAWVDL